jgi:HupE / UreJ protein
VQGGAAPAASAHTAVIEPGAPARSFSLNETPSAPRSALGFLAEGVHHILIGTDHVLFLLALLLPAVLVRRSGARRTGSGARPLPTPPLWRLALAGGAAAPRAAATTRAGATTHSADEWRAAPALKPVLMDVLRVVTAFTVAHSITLALAALDVLDPPSRWVESIIAASVVLAALNNLHPVVREGRWMLTFGFGLVHGFGFAGALKDLGLAQGSLVAPLLGFNLGVELGQLLIVALFVPLAWHWRHSTAYRRVVLTAGSAAIALIAALWFVERAFDMQLLVAA